MEPSLKHLKNKKSDPSSESENITALEPGVSCRAAGFNKVHPQKQEKWISWTGGCSILICMWITGDIDKMQSLSYGEGGPKILNFLPDVQRCLSYSSADHTWKAGPWRNQTITCPEINPGQLYHYAATFCEETNYYQSFVQSFCGYIIFKEAVSLFFKKIFVFILKGNIIGCSSSAHLVSIAFLCRYMCIFRIVNQPALLSFSTTQLLFLEL